MPQLTVDALFVFVHLIKLLLIFDELALHGRRIFQVYYDTLPIGLYLQGLFIVEEVSPLLQQSQLAF